ncbi:hypothetical protein BP6252_08194 [Coleophoma cylindrospora]|uniref:Hydantoinase n=1 Tax=Coleophoma cylindrospora TaxID=1849047 RepID=A0A3D8RCL0_9HELO|nr:hypothetical protein BP6252_08194 [Coleophoma cylindrospora]
MYRIGVDVGGTNTDAAILDVTAYDTPSRGVLASVKTSTTPNITTGVQDSIDQVIAKSGVQKNDVLSVTIGTTHFVNAVVEADARRLTKVAVVRLCGPFTKQIPPFSDFPADLKDIVNGGTYYVDGGLEIDCREIVPVDPMQVRETLAKIVSTGITTICLVGVFSPLDHAGLHEERCKNIMLEANPAVTIVCSHNIGTIGLLERENATILNASILAVARKTFRSFSKAMLNLGLRCPLYITQNDGTLTDVATASETPVKTFASGPTNSMIGAAFLAGLDKSRTANLETEDELSGKQILVVDVGGTTTDVCALLPSGFPRQAPNFVEVGGVRTAFSMPEVCSLGLGGGSRVHQDEKTGDVTVGPNSVGHFLTSQALVFGGDVMTSTDIVVASKKQILGDPKLASHILPEILTAARRRIKKMLEGVIDDMKVSSAPVTVLLVGGGSIIHMDDLENVAEVIRPPHHDGANAVGAAIAKVAGEIDVIEILHESDEKAAIARLSQAAIDAAVQRGALRESVKIVRIEKLPLAYVTDRSTRIIITAVGSLAPPNPSTSLNPLLAAVDSMAELDAEDETEAPKEAKSSTPSGSPVKPSLDIDIPTYRPTVRRHVWYLSEVDIEFIACGTGVLGTGGGGTSYYAMLHALDVLRRTGQGKMRVISLKALQDDDRVGFGSYYGAPSAMNEKISSGTEIQTAIDTLDRVLGNKGFNALLADEIGGGNGLAAFPVGSHYDRPVIDGDAMGRAYPTMEHSTLYIYGQPIVPCAIADGKGNVSVVMSAESNARVETMLRTTSIDLGLTTAVVACPLPGSAVKQLAIPNTVSQAWYLGRAIHMARKAKTSIMKAIFDVNPGKLLFSGKIVDLSRGIAGGYTIGKVLLSPLLADEKDEDSVASQSSATTATATDSFSHISIVFQNEYLYARRADAEGIEGEILCTVPDLISILDQDGEAVGSQDLKYGLKVHVIGMPAHPLWTSKQKALDVGGPKYFGLDMEWTSVGEYTIPRSVIDDFNSEEI